MSKFYKSSWFRSGLAWAAARYVGLAMATQRWTLLGSENLRQVAENTPMVAVLWHEALPSILVMWREARRLGMTRPTVVLASAHQDGQLIGQIMQYHGMGLVSGSSNRGGAKALRALVEALNGGANAVITPDGPRGPRRVAAPGIAHLAALSGARLLPCAALTSPAITLNTWDKMRLPLPFGRGVLAVGAPISVPRDNWQASLPEITAALNALMDQAGAAL